MNFIFDNDRPIYIQLVEQIKIYIISGKIELGSRLLSVRDLALQLQVNPNTVQKALTELEESKLIYTERTNGKFVTNDKKLVEKVKKELAKEMIDNYLNDMSNLGFSKKEAVDCLKERKI